MWKASLDQRPAKSTVPLVRRTRACSSSFQRYTTISSLSGFRHRPALARRGSLVMPTSHWHVVKPPPCQRIPRKHPRYLLSVPITLYRVADKTISPTHGLTLNISKGGVAAVLCGSACVGEIFRVQLNLWRGVVSALAVVRHANSFNYGFEFLDPTPELRDRLAECLHDLDH